MKIRKTGSKKKTLLTAAILTAGVSLIPLLYSSTYVASVWDVYGNTSHIPVAVVNEDAGSRYNDEDVNYGNTLVEKLKENDNLQWHFVSADEAENGLKGNEKYYAVITIPSDFSKNLTSSATLDKAQASIEYSANEKKNYVASMILKSAMSSLKDKIKTEEASKISDTLVNKLNEVPEKLGLIADGAGKLEDGSEKLASGFTSLNSGADLLTEKLFDLSNGLDSARSGVDKLTEASGNLAVLADGASQLSDGSYTLSNGISSVTDAAGKLSDGSKKIDSSVLALKNGADSINNGLGALSNGLNTFTSTVTWQIGSSKDSSAAQVSSGIDSAMTKASEGINSSIDSGLASALDTALGDSSMASQSLSAYLNGVNSYIDNSSKYTVLPSAVSAYADSVSAYNAKVQELTNAIDSGDTAQIASLSAQVKALSPKIGGSTSALKSNADSLAGQAAAIKAGGDSLKDNGSKIASIPSSVRTGLEYQLGSGLKNGISTALHNQLAPVLKSSITASMNSGLDKLSAGISGGVSQLQTGISGINGSGYIDADGKDPALLTGSARLSDGLSQLKSGSDSLSTNMSAIYNVMNTQISPGAVKLSSASTQLADGADKLTAMKDGLRTLQVGMNTAADGSRQLSQGAVTLSSGLQAAADGNSQLNDGLNTLNTGLNDSITASKDQLRTTDGLGKQAGDGIDVVSKPFDHVHNYGESFAPYFMNVSLWTGGLVALMTICFDFKRRLKNLGPDSPKPMFRFFAFCGISVAQAMLAGLVAQFGLGLNINHPGIYYAGLITISLTYTWIIEFFMLIFGDIGKMLSMVLMVLQLTSTGGTFPVEVSAPFFQFLNPLLPMTYGVRLLKEAISGSDPAYAWKSLMIVLAFGLANVALLFFGLGLKKLVKKKNKDLPSVPETTEANI